MLFWILLVVLVLVGWYFIALRWQAEWYPDEIHFLPITGERHLTVHRFKPEGGVTRKHPVILCHGLSASRFNLALPGRHSVASVLNREGYDVWVIDLTGCGMSVPRSWLHPKRYDSCFDDYVDRDGPMVIEHVLAETGADQVFWCGHSMGGMILYAMAQFDIAKKIAGGVAIASPAAFDDLGFFDAIAKRDYLLKFFNQIDVGFFSRLTVPVVPYLPDLLHRPMLEAANMHLEDTRYVACNVLSTTPVRLLLQFSEWVKNREVRSRTGYPYQTNLNRVTLPILLLSAKSDLLASPRSVEYAYDHVSSEDKTYRYFALENEGKADYGHGDIVFGNDAPDEVFPVIRDWFNARD
ncbi:MAG: alpha/beta fold hydrolase [Deltaproteobacteria bacterium]|nr:alpha/beta fold hydrolase [Deltaproteobacteria bacterium]MCB9490278.1 alpha/beta fold hydrolase [Deltaproteobacteria bacterium]